MIRLSKPFTIGETNYTHYLLFTDSLLLGGICHESEGSWTTTVFTPDYPRGDMRGPFTRRKQAIADLLAFHGLEAHDEQG